jgi:hypothetical protein
MVLVLLDVRAYVSLRRAPHPGPANLPRYQQIHHATSVESMRAQPTQNKDDGEPFKAEIIRYKKFLTKSDRILPPCDRCRWLDVACIKGKTAPGACMGCSQCHKKCF